MNQHESAEAGKEPSSGSPCDAGEPEVRVVVGRFIEALAERYRFVGETSAAGDDVDRRLGALELGRAALHYAGGVRASRPPQVAVLGPTQTGKSTIVNLILNTSVARVSPLAGFTIHPQGFLTGESEGVASGAGNIAGWVADLFPGWRRCEPEELDSDEGDLERYVLVSVGEDVRPPGGMPGCVVWDTPDFDSLAARGYQRGVLEAAALADVHVFVLSKEKYSDLSVWRMLRLLKPLDRPLVICLNKLTPDAKDALVASLRERLEELGVHAARVPIIALEYQPGLGVDSDVEALPEVWELRDRIGTRLKAVGSVDSGPGALRFIKQHWLDWVAPVQVELAAVAGWGGCVDEALREAIESYQRDFLDHPKRFDTFRRATVELLHLMELPGLAGTLGQVRHVLSWPARRLFAARQAWAARRFRDRGVVRGVGSEEIVLYELIERLLTSLERDAARRSDPTQPGHAVWRAIAGRLEQDHTRLRRAFREAAREQRDDFVPVIREAADRLYEKLSQRPGLLNTLRAARTTTDVAAIALAIKTGGLGMNDLLFAPAMFGLTSMLAEGALGSYMTLVARDLKRRQLEHVRKNLIDGVFAVRLRELSADLSSAGLFGIAEEQLREATGALEAWEARDHV